MVFETNDTSDQAEDWAIVHHGRNRQECSDKALVLHSLSIPCNILSTDSERYALAVPSSYAEKARFEIWEYEQENKPAKFVSTTIKPDYERAIPGVIGYILVVVAIAWASGASVFGSDWLAAGRIDGSLIREGEWWRVFTALTLHGSLKHLLGNIVFGALFGLLAGGLLGPGIAWLGIVIAAAAANTVNVFLLDATHRSIGASTAVFAALGMLSGFVWRAKLMAQERWAWRLGPIVGGLALLAYTGTGDENTDVGAHLVGFVCGFGSGIIMSAWSGIRVQWKWQIAAGIVTLAILADAWLIALLSWN
jgi:rhomboid protease GluP